MSAFSDVDAAVDPARLIGSLEASARGLASMKHYMALAHRTSGRSGTVLDVGCGAGHDVAVLAHHGIDGVGVDPSAVMLEAAVQRMPGPFVRAVGNRLPFRDGSFAGGWIERVLMHVDDPVAVLAEVVRCLEPGGLITVFEPDWSSLTINGVRLPPTGTAIARHPAVGSDVGGLLRGRGCFVRDRVEERSWWTFDQFRALTAPALLRAAATPGSQVQSWIDRAQALGEVGTFDAEMVKVLWVATTPDVGLG